MDDVARGVASFFGWFGAAEGGEPGSLLWSADPHVQLVILAILTLAVSSILFIYAPFSWLMIGVGRLHADVAELVDGGGSLRLQALRGKVDDAFLRSPIAAQWEVFLARWRSTMISDATGDRAPVRLGDVLEEVPVLPSGARKSLLAALPGLFLASGTLGALVAIALAIPSAAQLENLQGDLQVGALASSIEMALRSALWGLLLSMAAALASRALEGRAERRVEQLDALVSRVYAFAPAADLLSARGEVGQLRGELAQMLDEHFAAQVGAIRGLHELVSEFGRSQRAASPAAVGASELTRATDGIHAAARTFAGAAKEIDTKLDNLRRVSRSLEEAAQSVGGGEQSLDDANDRFRILGDSLRKSLRESMGEMRNAIREAGMAAASARPSDADRERLEAGLARVEQSLTTRLDGFSSELTLGAESQAIAAAAGELREVAASLRQTLGDASRAEENAAAQRSLIEEELGRLSEVLSRGLAPLEQRFEQLGAVVEGAVARRDDRDEAERSEMETALNRTLAAVSERLDPLRTRLDQLDVELTRARTSRDEHDEHARGALSQHVDTALERFNGAIGERFEQLGAELAAVASSTGDPSSEVEAQRILIEEGLAQFTASLSQRMAPLDARLEQLAAGLRTLAESTSQASGADQSGLEALASSLREVADDFGKALDPARGLISQLDGKTTDFFAAVKDLEAHVARTERSISDLRSGGEADATRLRQLAADLARQLEVAIAQLGKRVEASRTPDTGVARTPDSRDEHARNVQRALERARAAAASGEAESDGAQTRIVALDPSARKYDEVDTVPQVRVPKTEPAAITDPDDARPSGLSSLLSSKRKRRDRDD